MIDFVCDYCGKHVDNGDNMQAAGIVQVCKSLEGNDRQKAGELLPSKKNHFCNNCYSVFLKWVENDLRAWIRGQFPLEQVGDNKRAQ